MNVHSRYIIGIDLGTTNCSVAYFDTLEGNLENNSGNTLRIFKIPQLTLPGLIESRNLLPSFCYLADDLEFPKGSLSLPWGLEKKNFVGVFAKEEGAKIPTKQIQSAKSWLCNPAALRREKILPPEAADPSRRLSPVEASALYLRHLIESWNFSIAKGDPSKEFEEQDIILTVPASFDEVARLLTVEAAKMAGLSKITLLEEPQAAFYSWIYTHEKDVKERFQPGDSLLVVDVGGGTTDFSLIDVTATEKEASGKGELGFQRRAVGNHLLLGGDNMDLALAHHLQKQLQDKLQDKLDSEQFLQLVIQARNAKEKLLGEESCERISLLLQGKGSKVVGGSVGIEVDKQQVATFLVDGFFHEEPLESALKLTKKSGIRSMGLGYEAETSILKHLAEFLHVNNKVPDYVLFNGGSMKPHLFRNAVLRSIGLWFKCKEPSELKTFSLDLAVARGAAYFGSVQRGFGMRISGGLARAYYLQIQCENADGSIETKALTLLPKGAEDGFQYESEKLFALAANSPVSFQLLSSNVRLDDTPGLLVPISEEEMLLLPPIQTVLRYGKSQEKIHVRLCTELTSIGTIQLWLQSTQTEHKWLLEFQLKSQKGSENALFSLEKRRVDETHVVAHLEKAKNFLLSTFKEDPKNIVTELENVLELPKAKWPPSILRGLFDTLLELKSEIFTSLQREIRFWNLAGFCVRPGFGYPLDDYRIKELWKIILSDFKKQKTHDCLVQRWICYRRISGGLNKGQQVQLASELLAPLYAALEAKNNANKMNSYEYAESLRLLASLEYLAMEHKIRLGNLLIKRMQQKKAVDVDFWALGRIGARNLLVASFVNVVPSNTCSLWLAAILESKELSESVKTDLIEKLARKSGRNELNIKEELLSRILRETSSFAHKERLHTLLTEVHALEQTEQEELLGEQLPPGLLLLM